MICCSDSVDAGFRFKPDDVPTVQLYDNGVLKVRSCTYIASTMCFCNLLLLQSLMQALDENGTFQAPDTFMLGYRKLYEGCWCF